MGWCFAVVRNGRFEIEDFFLQSRLKLFHENFNQLVG